VVESAKIINYLSFTSWKFSRF